MRSFLLLLLVAVSTLNAQTQSFQAAFDKYVHDDAIVGASYVWMDGAGGVERRSLGWADRERNQSVDQNTIFHWGSITKTLTAVAVMRLRDEGKISLDDSITKYVPELTRIHSDYGPVSQVTLRHLLSHSAGFQNPTWPYRDDTKPWQPFEPTEWSQLVAMMPYQELHFKPGARYSYSNPGFIYLARVMEKVTGLSWEEYIRKYIFTPLGMSHSYFNITPAALEKDRSANYTRLSGGTVRSNGREFDTGITTPNGGLNAPLGDLVRWVSFLAGTSPVKDSLLAHKTLEEMWRPVVTVSSSPERPESMGLSFFIDLRGGDTFVGHTGSQAGFHAFFAVNPTNGRAIIAAFNTSHAQGEGTEYDALRELAYGLLK